jgi:hypothetical protein
VEHDEVPNPVYIGLLGAPAAVPNAQGAAYFIEELGGWLVIA